MAPALLIEQPAAPHPAGVSGRGPGTPTWDGALGLLSSGSRYDRDGRSAQVDRYATGHSRAAGLFLSGVAGTSLGCTSSEPRPT